MVRAHMNTRIHTLAYIYTLANAQYENISVSLIELQILFVQWKNFGTLNALSHDKRGVKQIDNKTD